MNFLVRYAWLACLISSPLLAQPHCSVKVVQDGHEVVRDLQPGQGHRYVVKPSPFEIAVAPSSCAPTIAAIPSNEIARKIFAQPLIYSDRRGFAMAATEKERDVLIWWARTSFDSSFLELPEPRSFERQQYDKLCDELRFCPTVYPIFSSGWPFVDDMTGSQSVAAFKRADFNTSIEVLKDKRLALVVYTVWRSLPTQYPMANPIPYLFRPHYLQIDFSGK